MALDRRLKVMRKRRRRTLLKKIFEFSSLFDEDIAVITRDRKTKVSKVAKSTADPDWLPALENLVRDLVILLLQHVCIHGTSRSRPPRIQKSWMGAIRRL